MTDESLRDETTETAVPVSTETAEDNLLRFLLLYNKHYRDMFIFAKSIIPGKNEVEDIMQEASLTLWKKFPSFPKEGNFIGWALEIIRIEILRWRRSKSLEYRLFDEQLAMAIAGKMQEKDFSEIDRRCEAMLECIERLNPKMKDLIFKRYFSEMGIEQIAEQSHLSVDAVYQRLSRIRGLIKNCVAEKINR